MPHLEDFALDAQLIAWPHRTRPADLIEAGPYDPAYGLEFAFNQEAHGDHSGMPTARGQTAEYSVLRCRSEMERLRIEFRSKAIDSLFVDAQAPGAKGLSHRKVLEVLLQWI
jgi:hypothetical protein